METVLSIIAIVLSAISGVFTAYTFLWTRARDCKQATLEAYNRLQAEVFDNLNAYKPSEIREICSRTQSEEYKIISGYLARIEHFCVGLNYGIYDKKTFYALAHGYFDKDPLRKRIEPVIEKKNQSKNTKEQFYKETLSVISEMDKRTAKQ